MKDFELWFWIIFFIVLPVLQTIFRKITQKKNPALEQELAGRRAEREERRQARRAAAELDDAEHDELPEWFDPAMWEDVSADLDELDRQSVRSDTEVPPMNAGPGPFAPQPPMGPDGPGGAVILPVPSSPGREERRPAAPASPRLRERPAYLPPADEVPILAKAVSLTRRRTHPRRLPTTREDVRRGMIWSEVLGRPRALRPYRGPSSAEQNGD